MIKEYVPEELYFKVLDDKSLGRKMNTRVMGRRFLEWWEENKTK